MDERNAKTVARCLFAETISALEADEPVECSADMCPDPRGGIGCIQDIMATVIMAPRPYVSWFDEVGKGIICAQHPPHPGGAGTLCSDQYDRFFTRLNGG